ncbi:hypothetical protein [Salipaludibacillus daqingensis]|nr:hypothetical protein [Salipaludibacillus daqingensis]
MGKQKGHRNKQAGSAITESVNPLGQAPDDENKGEVLSREQERAKKKNTK